MTTSSPSVTSALESKAKGFVDELARGEWTHAATPFDAAMAGAMPRDALQALWQKLEQGSGPFGGVERTTVEPKGDYRVVLVACRFGDHRHAVRVVFDKEEKVAGLFHAPIVEEIAWSAPSYARASAFEEREVHVGTAPALGGTLTLPKGLGPVPALVLVHGSGPNDRDETLGGVKPFKDLAWGLASKGIAVLRYEKRSRQDPSGIVTQKEEVLDAARDAIDLLGHTPGVDPRRIFVLGHSQGGYLAPRIAAANPSLAGIVILAGSTRPLEESLVAQLEYFATLDPKSAAVKAMLEQVRAFKHKVQGAGLRAEERIALPMGGGVTGAYFLDVRGYQPHVTAKAISRPLLILQGERDYQVTMTDFDGWKTLESKPNVTLRTYPSLNHLFVSGSGAPSPAEYELPGHVDEHVINDIVAWISTP